MFSPRVLPILPIASLFLPKIEKYSNSLYHQAFRDFQCRRALKPLILCGFLSSRDFWHNLLSSLKVGITTPTRNQFGSNPTWVRIPPAAPESHSLLRVAFFMPFSEEIASRFSFAFIIIIRYNKRTIPPYDLKRSSSPYKKYCSEFFERCVPIRSQ